MQGLNDNGRAGSEFLPSRSALFLPLICIAAGYGAFLAILALSGQADGFAFRFCVAVMALAVPFLFAHALLRMLTTRVRLLPHAALLHRGFPSLGAIEVPYGDIASLRVLRGIGGRISGAGTLLVGTEGGARTAVCDLADPEAARDCIAVYANAARKAGFGRTPAGARPVPVAATTA